jgi:3-deoxy-D-manno-octulosonic-acid transferase
LILGSTWPQDEAVWIPAFCELLRKGNLGRVILAPHEISSQRLEDIQNQLRAQQVTFCLYSTLSNSSLQNETSYKVLILDQIGILPEIYAFGDIAFVGGSFRGKVHSVMEPLAWGLPVATGPFFSNNREALDFSKKTFSKNIFMVTPVFSTQDCLQWIKNISDFQINHGHNCDYKKTIEKETRSYEGASSRFVQNLKKSLHHLE